jgi:uncharacterized membrane protein
MTINWLLIDCSVAVIGCAMSAGLFYTFSDFVLRSMHLAKTAAGVQVMQNVNREIMRSGSIYLLWGTVVLSSALGILAAFTAAASAAIPMAVGGLLIFAGVLLVTYRFNVPMNIRLGKLSYAESPAANYWPDYVLRWNRWNWVRAWTSAGASVSFLVACLMLV